MSFCCICGTYSTQSPQTTVEVSPEKEISWHKVRVPFPSSLHLNYFLQLSLPSRDRGQEMLPCCYEQLPYIYCTVGIDTTKVSMLRDSTIFLVNGASHSPVISSTSDSLSLWVGLKLLCALLNARWSWCATAKQPSHRCKSGISGDLDNIVGPHKLEMLKYTVIFSTIQYSTSLLPLTAEGAWKTAFVDRAPTKCVHRF